MSYAEAQTWFGYRAKHGALTHARTHQLLAMACTMQNNAAGGKATLQDFLPGAPAPEPIEIDDASYMLRFWSAAP